MYVDTSSAAGIQPHLLEYAVEKIGAEKILFGTVRAFASASHPAFGHLFHPDFLALVSWLWLPTWLEVPPFFGGLCWHTRFAEPPRLENSGREAWGASASPPGPAFVHLTKKSR